MKKFILIILFPFLSLAQEDNWCKDMAIQVLTIAYKNETNFNEEVNYENKIRSKIAMMKIFIDKCNYRDLFFI